MITALKIWRCALWISPAVLVAASFFAAAEWIDMTFGATTVLLLAAAAAVFVMGYSVYLSARVQRRLDEVQKANAGFSARWGPSVGEIAFVLLLLLPPVQEAMAAIVGKIAADPGTAADRSIVVLSMTVGFMGVVLLQTIGKVVMSAIWWTARR